MQTKFITSSAGDHFFATWCEKLLERCWKSAEVAWRLEISLRFSSCAIVRGQAPPFPLKAFILWRWIIPTRQTLLLSPLLAAALCKLSRVFSARGDWHHRDS